MRCSPEKLAANRRNSAKSTGPRTPEGKAASRRNGLKHGLTGAGIVIPDEDVRAVEDRFEGFEASLKPKDDVARFLTRRAALLSVRLDRCARQEAAQITQDMLSAEDAEADARAEEFARLVDMLDDRPTESVRKLRRSVEGIDWLIRSWNEVKASLLDRVVDRWSPERAQRLSGRNQASPAHCRIAALTSALRGNFRWLIADEWSDLPDPGRREAARSELAGIIDREIAGLEAVRDGLDRESIAKDRSGARARAIFDPSQEAVLARKYEAAAERGFFKTLKEIERINSTAEETEEFEASPEPVEDCDELASSFSGQGSYRRDAKVAERGEEGEERKGGKNRISSLSSLCPSP